ncbi:hypothetical protein PMIN01_09986 [Paraphaeosphaeria minitans]|uniref:Uncharacterized protein n=1 Tax=Paraphaeosphaeria minitans TaxID=565426 RepID=A0A9P6GAR4_9PLEO|nr:hypothetical protein PMIN01_09986 [Paraphaeosphaeria minitans]
MGCCTRAVERRRPSSRCRNTGHGGREHAVCTLRVHRIRWAVGTSRSPERAPVNTRRRAALLIRARRMAHRTAACVRRSWYAKLFRRVSMPSRPGRLPGPYLSTLPHACPCLSHSRLLRVLDGRGGLRCVAGHASIARRSPWSRHSSRRDRDCAPTRAPPIVRSMRWCRGVEWQCPSGSWAGDAWEIADRFVRVKA